MAPHFKGANKMNNDLLRLQLQMGIVGIITTAALTGQPIEADDGEILAERVSISQDLPVRALNAADEIIAKYADELPPGPVLWGHVLNMCGKIASNH